MKIDEVFSLIRQEHARAKTMHPKPFANAHEGYAVLLEEVDELWDEVKADNLLKAQKEAVQVGAMVVRFITELKG